MATQIRKTRSESRILAAASDLFYEHGLRGVGIDQVIATSESPSRRSTPVPLERRPRRRLPAGDGRLVDGGSSRMRRRQPATTRPPSSSGSSTHSSTPSTGTASSAARSSALPSSPASTPRRARSRANTSTPALPGSPGCVRLREHPTPTGSQATSASSSTAPWQAAGSSRTARSSTLPSVPPPTWSTPSLAPERHDSDDTDRFAHPDLAHSHIAAPLAAGVADLPGVTVRPRRAVSGWCHRHRGGAACARDGRHRRAAVPDVLDSPPAC